MTTSELQQPSPRFNYRASVQRLLAGAQRLGVDTAPMLNAAAIDPRSFGAGQMSAPFVGGRQFLTLIATVKDRLGDELLGLSDRRMKPGAIVAMVDMVLSYETLGAALDQAVRFLGLVTEDIEFGWELRGDDAAVLVRHQRPELDPGNFVGDYWLLHLYYLFSWTVGYVVPIKRAELAVDEPHSRERIAWLLRRDWHPGAADNAFYFSRKYLSLPVLRTRNEWHEHIARARLGMLDWPDDEATCSMQVKGHLLTALNKRLPIPALSDIAKLLHLTPQTLRRHLADEGNGYQRLLDELRRDAAIERLHVHHLSVAEVAEQLGFSEPRSFSRAFKQWTGVSPTAYQINSGAEYQRR